MKNKGYAVRALRSRPGISFVNLVFLQRDLAHLPVANKGSCHLVDAFSRSYSDDVARRYEAASLFYLPLVAQTKALC